MQRLPNRAPTLAGKALVRSIFKVFRRPHLDLPPWDDTAPVREELFGGERLEQHAETLATAQTVTTQPPRVLSLHTRLSHNAEVLLAAYRASAAELERGRGVEPAAEWLLDNYHLVEEQIREIRDDLPSGYYRQLPKLAAGPFVGYPRVFGLAWAFVAHTDSHLDPDILRRFIGAYQRVQPLTIGELWAIAITLRIVLVENLRRLTDQITLGRGARAEADALADKLLVAGAERSALDAFNASREIRPLSERFAAQLVKRLRDQDPRATPALGWLEDALKHQGVSIDAVVQHAQQRQGASNVTVRNVITSMRLISDLDWTELIEGVSLVDARLCAARDFAAMDFPTRNMYRSAIEQLARRSALSELDVVERALALADHAIASAVDTADAAQVSDPGHFLLNEGRRALEREIKYRAPLRLCVSRCSRRLGIGGYIGAIAVGAAMFLACELWVLAALQVHPVPLALMAVLALIPATEVAAALVNRAITWSVDAVILPGLALKSGVPTALRTVVAVPALLTSEAELLDQIERLEVHHLSSGEGDLIFVLLLDGLDAEEEIVASDAPLLAHAVRALADLNRRYAPGPAGARFLLLHRKRVFNPGEKKWMGWERKRGKLHELNRLLRGATDTTFIDIEGHPPLVPSAVRYVITLDADTRLPRDAARRLIGKMAHPLNRPQFSTTERRVVGGYAILQPRVTPSLPLDREGSCYQRVFAGPSGMDPYAAAASDVYQDLFGEGSYTGKGIYDVDAFEAALAGRVPDNAMLSHDLFEGVFARAGLASDIEVVEEFPTRYDVAAKRQHRWTRGDWQLVPWIVGRCRGAREVPIIGRWKMLDNLRRSLLAPCTVLGLGGCWLLPLPAAIVGSTFLFATILIPASLPIVFAVAPRRAGLRLRNHLRTWVADLKLATLQIVLSSAFLADHGWRMGDAITRTLVRVCVTRRRLLEWTTAAQSARRPRLDLHGFYQQMIGSTSCALVMIAIALIVAPASWPASVPCALLWLLAPTLAWWTSRAPSLTRKGELSDGEARDLRLIARRTWRYFETFVTPADNLLPPDNFQEDPKPVIAHRTSPTNIGLYLLSTVAARDFGWAGTVVTVERLEATFDALDTLARFKGHFFNWYGTQDLQVLTPAYVSTVDSGNLAGHLLVVANACEEWQAASRAPSVRAGLLDTLRLAHEACLALNGERGAGLALALDEIESHLAGTHALDNVAPILQPLIDRAAKVASALTMVVAADDAPEVVFWIEALGRVTAEHARDRQQSIAELGILHGRLQRLADRARLVAGAMDFAFLLDPKRQLLSIGYSFASNTLDSSCYDLLASEARLASLFAVAKGDVTTRHWFRLGRSATPLGHGSALISWSGSMFEYLMPSLVMRAPVGSVLEQTNRLVVARQQAYGASMGIPWGISESAYNARDLEFTYQYSNFGVPGLGLKRGLSENLVVAPYAAGLATMIDPHAAHQNYARLALLGARGSYGFFEALDFTRSRLPDDERVAIVRTYMAHHQGMTIVAIANTLQAGQMRQRFHREPMIQACELLLQERLPREIAISQPRAEEVKASARSARDAAPSTRRLAVAAMVGAPVTHLLSNGRYAVMLTAAGAGYSRWRDIAITRWREDPTCDAWGSFIFVRDVQSGTLWSATAQPLGTTADAEVIFGEDHAEFTRRDSTLTTTLEVVISGEADGEVRRITLTNSGRRAREIELTSYAEVVLTPAAADNAHPAFTKLFVHTEHLAEFNALLATRRVREPAEATVCAAHFAVAEGELTAAPQYESDRAQFIGRGRGLASAVALSDGSVLSNTVGTVLDPIFALRYRVLIPPGGVARVAFWTVVASTREAVLGLIDQHHDRNAFDRARTLAWTQAQVQLRHLDIDADEAGDFQRLAAPILYADPRFRAPSAVILRAAGPQSSLWRHAISGDLPLVLLRIDDEEDMAQVHQLLRAHEYWRMKRLAVDLVIVNEHASSYLQDLQNAIELAVRSSQSRPRFGTEPAQGTVFILRADLVGAEARALLQSVARVALIARRGTIAAQLAEELARRAPALSALHPPFMPRQSHPLPAVTSTSPTSPELEFFNGLGGFDHGGREYVTILAAGRTTPAPWINVIANPTFGFQVSAEGSGYTWADNSRENQLTPWSNDPVSDPSGEVLYVRDEDTGQLWTATAQPIRDQGTYLARHGFGYSRFEHAAHGIELSLLQYVPLADPIKISRLTLRNISGLPRRLSVTGYLDWVLGTTRGSSGPFITTEIDTTTGALLARNPWSSAFAERIAFADLRGQQTSWTGDRTEFLGRYGALSAPQTFSDATPLSGTTGAGIDPCAALRTVVEIRAGESVEVVFFLGQGESVSAARELLVRYRAIDLDGVLAEVTEHWQRVLGAIQVTTPDRALDLMLNGWLLYQTISCRVWARCGFYQASGAYGFRDQLQDSMALTLAMPDETRRHLLRAASRQFVEGDVQHWWLPHSGQGVRTRISDDRVWLAFATATYITATDDLAILDEEVPFLDGPRLRVGVPDAFFQPLQADQAATLFEHCARGLDQCIALTGALGLPLIGTGDWNDGMNRVGSGGQGESVWLAWLLVRTLDLFAPLAHPRDPARAAQWVTHRAAVCAAIERSAWDGQWYRRATFDDGTWLGSSKSEECQIDSIAQSWAVLSGAADSIRAATAMAAMAEHLIRRADGLVLLFAPPFVDAARDPGYIKAYPPGVRENGAQYSHAAMWATFAMAQLGQHEQAAQLFALINPINHARTAEEIARYKVEPYVVAADIYSIAPHVGRGGWTWYTGAAGWMYRAGVEGILGIRREGAFLIIAPCIPSAWPGFAATVKVGATDFNIVVENSALREGSIEADLDGARIQGVVGSLRMQLDGASHRVVIYL